MSIPKSIFAVCCCLSVAACTQDAGHPPAQSETTAYGSQDGAAETNGSDSSATSQPNDAQRGLGSADFRAVALTPDNTEIQFVGTHVGDEPDPRTGVFTQFAGEAEIDPAGQSLRSVSVEIQTESLSTPIGKLTNHLKSPDFFDAREHPTARFESTAIAPGDTADQQILTGNLTLLGATKEISFPVTVDFENGELALEGTVTIDRTEFGMDRLQDRVNKEVEITVTVGKKTEAP